MCEQERVCFCGWDKGGHEQGYMIGTVVNLTQPLPSVVAHN